MIVRKSGGDFKPCPAGTHAAVCVDVVDLGMLPGFDGKVQHKIKIVWQVDELRDDGKPFAVSKRYTPSLHEKASLRKDLEAWRNQQFTDEELDGWDLENIIGAPAMLQVVHVTKNGKIFANIQAIMRLPKMMSAPRMRDYVRVKDRPVETDKEYRDEAPPEDFSQVPPPTDDDVPF